MSFRGRYVFKAVVAALMTMKRQLISPQTLCNDVRQFVTWSRIYSKAGLEGLEAETRGDVFLERCIYLAKQDYPEADFRKMAFDFIENDYYRQLVSANILSRLGQIAPAFGMVGTLIGLIIMLQSMGSDPSGIGKGLAVALITTLYGVILAKLFFEPYAGKVKEILGIERFRRSLLLEGFALLIAKRDPYFIMDRLNCKLDPKFIYDFEAERDAERAKQQQSDKQGKVEDEG